MKTIAYIVTRFTGETREAHISTIKRDHGSGQEAAIHLYEISSHNHFAF